MQKHYALVTGATSGIGFAIADILASKGYNLFLVSRNKKKLQTVKKLFTHKHKVTVSTLGIDLSKPTASRNVFAYAQRHKMIVDILVNNAGVGVYGEYTTVNPKRINVMLHLNMIALTELSTLFGAMMKKRRKGYILNVASTAGYQGIPYIASYAATKSYVLHFTGAIAKELEDYNVHVTCLSPGITRTGFLDAMGIQRKKGFLQDLGSMTSEQVARIAVRGLFSKKLFVVPGFWNKILLFIYRLLPMNVIFRASKKTFKHM